MNIANGPVRPTPGNLNPPINYCVQLTLPNDREWIGAFYDALYQLTYWFAWQRDSVHSGREIAAVWLSVLANMRQCSPVQSPDGCCDGGELLYRQNPDNPCLLESSADGVHWCTLFDASLCIPATGQPGGGSEQPTPGGGEVCYHINSPATLQALVPTTVSAGDTVTFNGFGGAANDGVPGRWDCPTGEYFFLGACQAGTEFTDPGDPLPSAPHDSLIAQIDGTWYSCLSPITVPGGVSGAQIVLQLNDGTIGDNSGEYAVNVCVTNNAADEWESTFNFALTSGGFIESSPDGASSWVPGFGWQAGDFFLSGNCYKTLSIRKNFSSADITHIEFQITSTLGYQSGSVSQQILYYAPARTILHTSANVSGAQTVSWDGALTLTNLVFSGAVAWRDSVSDCSTIDGAELGVKCIVRGTGPKPPEFP